MLKYAKIINEQSKMCNVGLGTNKQFYQSIGMIEQDVEQGYNGKWYLSGFAPQQPLEELKLAKRTEINQARDKAEQGGFEYMGKVFDSDEISCIRMSCAAQAMQMATMSEENPTITWTCQDNSTIDLTPAELLGLVVALAEWSNTCHQKATDLKAKIENATSREELEQINWNQ